VNLPHSGRPRPWGAVQERTGRDGDARRTARLTLAASAALAATVVPVFLTGRCPGRWGRTSASAPPAPVSP
jgi:hypothetical protein